MCYSAQVTASFRTYVRRLGARADLEAFHTLFERRSADPRIKVPKALEADFLEPHNGEEAAIAQVITSFHKDQAQRWEQELFKQRKRLADAQRQLRNRITKAATESQRIASAKVDALLARLRAPDAARVASANDGATATTRHDKVIHLRHTIRACPRARGSER